jgi:hypothetical protein
MAATASLEQRTTSRFERPIAGERAFAVGNSADKLLLASLRRLKSSDWRSFN